MKISHNNNEVKIHNLDELNLENTLECGQCFRWNKQGSGFSGTAFKRNINIAQDDRDISICNSNIEDFHNVWLDFFDLETDYTAIKENLSSIHPSLKKACEFSTGIRILKQEPWETLCSFIISQNNNIPRIKGIISRFCELFGDCIDVDHFSFPDVEKIACLNETDLAGIKCGFRAKYILDAAKRICDGRIDFDEIKKLSPEESRYKLTTILGVGPKVAECTLLFGFHKLNAFPIDIWMKRAMQVLFPGIDPSFFGEYRGVAQQYIFYYSRMHPELFK